MSLFGNLEDLPLPYFLQTIAENRITGKLVLRRREGHGLIVFREGKIIYAASNAARETVGSILLHRGLVSVSTLEEALARQGRAREERRLGSILLEMRAVEEPALHRVMKEQVESVLVDLFEWHHGFVKFEPVTIPERGEISVDATDLLVQEGLSTNQVVMEVMRRVSERKEESVEREILDILGQSPGEPIEPSGTEKEKKPSLATLKSIMQEIRTPTFTGEVTLRILRFAAAVLDRAILFHNVSDQLTGMGQVGFEDGAESADERVRRIRIPAEEPSVFLEALEKRETYRGPLESYYQNHELIRRLGGPKPEEVVVIPMIVGDRVALLLYGDMATSGRELPTVDEIELLMIQAGLAVEKKLLEERLVTLHNKRGQPMEQLGS